MKPILESEAAKLTCPFRSDGPSRGCIGSACMLWQAEARLPEVVFVPLCELSEFMPTSDVAQWVLLGEDEMRGRQIHAAATTYAAKRWPGRQYTMCGAGPHRLEPLRSEGVEFSLAPTEQSGACGASR